MSTLIMTRPTCGVIDVIDDIERKDTDEGPEMEPEARSGALPLAQLQPPANDACPLCGWWRCRCLEAATPEAALGHLLRRMVREGDTHAARAGRRVPRTLAEMRARLASVGAIEDVRLCPHAEETNCYRCGESNEAGSSCKRCGN
ncbi:hypothetical protein [Streptomyces sp. NPDC018031]|uniref:hypothetical protein n=1 Tax=Streptomyces sp. NPDC018031 TaxID=3365033 RepID=UPI00379CC7F0